MIEMITNFLAPYISIVEPYAAIYGAAVAFCTAVVKFTSTKKDDAIWEKVIKVLDFFSTAYRKIDAEKLKK